MFSPLGTYGYDSKGSSFYDEPMPGYFERYQREYMEYKESKINDHLNMFLSLISNARQTGYVDINSMWAVILGFAFRISFWFQHLMFVLFSAGGRCCLLSSKQ